MARHPPGWISLGETSNRADLHDACLVLDSAGIVHRTAARGPVWSLEVAERDAERARAELQRFQDENRDWPPPEHPPPPHRAPGLGAVIAYAFVLILMHTLSVRGTYGVDWTSTGLSDASRILAGEWWRAVTALTLHSGIPHLAGNVVFGSLFLLLLSRQVGAGLAIFCTLASGTLGNLVNAWWRGAPHLSLGASTAVFGTVGVLSAVEWIRRRRLPLRPVQRYAPLVLGVMFLGYLGIPYERPDVLMRPGFVTRTDVLAHCLGLAAGVLVGSLLGFLIRNREPPARLQRLLIAAASAVLVLAWTLAIQAA